MSTQGRPRTSTSRASVRTNATAHQAFVVLADLAGYSDWLPKSLAYRATSARTGTRSAQDYVDHTGFGSLTGTVTERVPDRRISFLQSTSRRHLTIAITYDVVATDDGSLIERTGTITTCGVLRWLHPIVMAPIRQENTRTMTRLRTHLNELARTTRKDSP